MAVRVTGLTRTKSRLRLRRQRTNEAAKMELRETAEELRDVAQLMAPRKSGSLESAILIDDEILDSPVRLRLDVFVDGSVPDGSSPDTNRTVARYAEIIHDNLTPVSGSTLNLGEISQEKDRGSPHRVGGSFMDRAFGEVQPSTFAKFKQAVKRALRL